MLLEKVIVENIRSHKYYKLEPLIKGITAINGENGSGKSTLLDSVAWSLFGTKVNGQKNKDLIREGVDPKEKSVKVTTYIRIKNQRYKIVRQIMDNSGLVNCKVYSKLDDNKDWKFESGPSVKHAEKEIRKILNTDEKGFLSSVFIQQKQVDQIISSSPKERGQVIEKLIGVSAITESINLGKEKIKILQKSAGLIKPDSLEESQRKIEEQAEKVKQIKLDIEELEVSKNKAEHQYIVTKDLFIKEKNIQEKVDNITNELNVLKNSKKILEEQLENNEKLIKNTSKKGKNKIPIDLLEIEISEKSSEINILKEKLFKLQSRNNELEDIFGLELEEENIVNFYNNTIKEFTELKEEDNIYINNAILNKEKLKSLKNLIKLLKKGKGECSLCQKPFTNPKEELERHQIDLLNLQDEIKKNTDEHNIIKEKLEELETQKKDLELSLNTIEQQKEFQEEFNNIKNNIRITKVEIQNLTKELDIINKKLISAKSEQKTENLIEEAKKQIIDNNNRLTLTNKEIVRLNDNLKQLNAVSKKDFKSLEKKLDEDYNKHIYLQNEYKNKNFELELEKEKGRTIFAEYKNCKKANEDYKTIVEQLNILKISNQTLQQFKKERIKTSIPSLTKIASEIMSKFTDGKFTELVINEKFEAFTRTEKQNLRPVSLLSGGELSSAAIALRIAISLFLSSEQESLLILDEVLVSMSEDRSQSILETIAEISKSQIIFIAHNVSINQFADKVVQL